MRAILLPGFVALLLLASLALPDLRAVDISATITGPDGVAPRASTIYVVRVQGTEGLANVTYRAQYWVEASDTTGAAPLKASPQSTTSFNNTLRINITAPAPEGSMDVNVKVTVNGPGGNYTTTATKSVAVAHPWTIRFPIVNDGPVAAHHVLVSFFLDGRFIGNTTLATIPASTAAGPGRTNATLTWVPVNVAPGGHELKVTVDLNADGKIEPELGDYVATQTIYRASGAIPAGYVALATVLTTLAFAATIFYIRRRRTKR